MSRTDRRTAPRTTRWAVFACAMDVEPGLLKSGVPSYAMQQPIRGQMPG